MDFQCPHCGEELTVDDSLIGMRGKCPECGNIIVVPNPNAGVTGEALPGTGPAEPPPKADLPADAASAPENAARDCPDSSVEQDPAPPPPHGVILPPRGARQYEFGHTKSLECQVCGCPIDEAGDMRVVMAHKLREAVLRGFLPSQVPMVHHEVLSAQRGDWLPDFDSLGVRDLGEGAVYSLCRPRPGEPYYLCEATAPVEEGERIMPRKHGEHGRPVENPPGLFLSLINYRARPEWILCEWCAERMRENTRRRNKKLWYAIGAASGALLLGELLYWIF
jgi:predicted Zn finger-like uncharacterized protein